MPSAYRYGPSNTSHQKIVDDIIQGIQQGNMAVENIHVHWDGHIQRYELQIYDMGRTAQLLQAAVAGPFSVPPQSKNPPKVPEDLGTTTTPIIGYRDFLLGTATYPMPVLISRNKSPWPMREPMRAFCNNGPLSRHDAPAPLCECGIYAFSKPDDASLKNGDVVWGEIAMWGEVLICGNDEVQGYRSEFAYPKTLFMRDTGTKAIRWMRDYLADGYGVPVLLVKEREGKTATAVMAEMLANLSDELERES